MQTRYIRGFSLMELILVIALCAGIFAIMLPYGFDTYRQDSIRSSQYELLRLIRTARMYSQIQIGTTWGVYIDTNTATLFLGDQYTVRDSQWDQQISFAGDAALTATEPEVVFESGIPVLNEPDTQWSVLVDTIRISALSTGAILYETQ